MAFAYIQKNTKHATRGDPRLSKSIADFDIFVYKRLQTIVNVYYTTRTSPRFILAYDSYSNELLNDIYASTVMDR